jgi:hypothetical protein
LALRDLYNVEGRLRFLMGLTPNDGRLIRPIDEPTTAAVDFDWICIHEESLIRSAELRQQKWLIQRRELELVAARNQLLPQFDLGVTYRWFGIGDELINADRNGLNFPAVGSTAFDVLTEGQFQEAAFFLQYQMPVGFRRELAGVRNSQLILAREKARLQEMELNTSHLLSSAVRNLDANRQIAQTHFERWSTAIQEVQTTQTLLLGGKITLDLVLDAQRRRAQAQIDYYRAIIDYNKSIADVHFRKGSLLEFNNVTLSEGPWPEKAYWDALGRARERDSSYYLNYGWTRPRVVSQGPVAQHWGESQNYVPSGDSPESIPPGEPTPAQPHDVTPVFKEELPESAKPQPPVPQITIRPDEPQLNSPQHRADAGTASDSTAAVGTGAARGFTRQVSAAWERSANPLRQASHHE